MAQTEQENAYRSERKERLAKNSARKNKKKIDSTSVVSGIIIAIGIIVALGIVAGCLYAYGVPQRIFPAVKVEDRTYSVADYGFYYTSVYEQYAQQSYNTYEQYGISLGFDYQKDPADQMTKDADGNDITYAEFFKNSVVETLEASNYYLKLAKAEGMELTEENKAEIDEQLEAIKTNAASSGYSANRYANAIYGKGVNIKKLRSLLEDQYLVAQYVQGETDKAATDISMDEIEARFNEDPDAYKAVDLRLFGLEIKADEEEAADTTDTADETEAEENTEATENEPETDTENAEPSKQELLANEMLEKVTDEESFAALALEYCAEEDKAQFEDDSATIAIGITKATVNDKIDPELAEWLFSADRQVGDKTVAVTDDYAYVIMIKNTAYRNETPLVNARHILVSFDTVQEQLAANESAETDETLPADDETEAVENVTDNEETTVEETTEEETTAEATTEATETEAEETDENIDLTDTKYASEVLVEAHKQAVDILDEYKAGEQTEEAFAALAEKYSADQASLSANGQSEGGLYTGINKGQMVKEFEDWVYDAARKTGDVDIIKTSYGYHIMYFVSSNEEAPWIENIRAAIANEKTTAREEEVKTASEGTASVTSFVDYAVKEALKQIGKRYGTN